MPSLPELRVGDLVRVLEDGPFWGRREGRVTDIRGTQHIVDFDGLRANFLREELFLILGKGRGPTPGNWADPPR